MKNIPIPPKNTYLKKLIEKTENVIKRMKWKAFFFEKQNKDDQSNSNHNENFGFKSRKCPPQNEDLAPFENDLLNMIKHIQSKNTQDDFQDQLRKCINRINNSSKAFIPADKSTNYYELDKKQQDQLLKNNITATYKKANESTTHKINNEARNIATDLNIHDRAERMAKRQAFITLDHKENFKNNPKVLLSFTCGGLSIKI